MRITHVQGTFSPEHGGPVHTLTNYCRGQIARGHAVSVWVLEGFPHTSPAIRLEPPCEMHVFKAEFPVKLGRSPRMKRAMSLAPDSDVYHLHGGWLRAPYYGACEAQRRKRPYIVEMMGLYEPYSLKSKWLRKWIARRWYQDQILQRSTCLHVNSEREARQLRELGFQRPIAVIPCGVDLAVVASNQNMLPKTAPWPQLEGHRFALFLARIDVKKGIELLLRAWKYCAAEHPEWILVIAGTGEPDYVAKCKALAADLEIERNCLWTGPVNDMAKSWLYSKAACFVLSSYSENFGNTAAEALAHGTPVIATLNTPWTNLAAQNCGWSAQPTWESLRAALISAMTTSESVRDQMRRSARRLAAERYSLSAVLNQLELLYEWTINGAVRPDFVRLD